MLIHVILYMDTIDEIFPAIPELILKFMKLSSYRRIVGADFVFRTLQNLMGMLKCIFYY